MSLPENPITNPERYASVIAGQNTTEILPEHPVTRLEEYWDYIARNGGGGGLSVQSDWNEADDTKPGYIKNKPTIPDVSNKADKVASATAGNFAGLDGNGNLTDSGKKAADFEISNAATGTSLTLTDATNGCLQGITIKGHSEVVSGAIKSVGDAGLGVVDLGTLTWVYSSEDVYFVSDTISPKPIIPGAGDNGLCSNYIVVTNATIYNMPNKSVLIGSGSASSTYRVCVKDTSYTDAATFKTAMSGVILYYPLASTTGATPTLGITAKNGIDKGTAATITTALPLRSTFDGTVYDELTNNSVITRCEVSNDTVVAKETPIITPLTSAEKSALATLKTYPNTTHIEATDSPNMTVDYLLDTDNGKAMANMQARIIDALSS